jgi:hypothetical protein
MPAFSQLSLDKLHSADSKLQMVMKEVIRYVDCTILCGHREKKEQDAAVASGASKTPWPTSKHNSMPSRAIDVAPYPIDWSNRPKTLARFYYLAGYIKSIADSMGVSLRWGGDWDGDLDFTDQNFDDLPHFELIGDK